MNKETIKAVALFNWISARRMNDKKIGELSMSDLMELLEFLEGIKGVANHA